jgi:iron complex outermembrane receptor protein
MKIQTTRERLLASTMICGVLALAGASPALAQTQSVPPAPATEVPEAAAGEVIVTGSRIPQPNLTSVAPVTVVGNLELKAEGTVRVEDLLNNLPQVAAEQGGSISNGATGTATVNLRNLGSSRTLVLIDGRRLNPGDPIIPVPDLNMIPAALVDRIEIDTASASSIYGSDAVAGVVNFIMKKNFEGAEVNANYGFYQHGQQDGAAQSDIAARGFQQAPNPIVDGFTYDVTGTIGVNSPDGKGNVTAYVGYSHLDPVTQAKRDFSACSLSEVGSHFVCAGSGTSASGEFIIFDKDFNYVVDTPTGSGAGASFRPFTTADQYNFAPLNYFLRQDERYNGGFFAHYEVNPALDVYSQFMFMDDHTQAQIAPSGAFGQTFTINCSDPLLTASEMNTLCGPGTTTPGAPGTATLALARRNVEGGPRIDDLRHTDYLSLIGARGDLDPVWHYDVSAQYGVSVFSEEYLNDTSLAKEALALNDCVDAPASGIDSACAPWNVFVPGGVTRAATNYIDTPGFKEGDTTQAIVTATLTGELGKYGLKSPFANDGVGVDFGFQYTRNTLNLQVDEEFSSGDLAGQGGPTPSVAGAYDVKEFFVEARIPLIQDAPFAKSLVLNGSYRYSDYSISGAANTYAVGPTWAVNDDILLRGGYNRAVRAPNVVELFSPQTVGLDFNNDPCAGPVGAGSPTAVQCARTGVSAAQYGNILANSANQYNGLLGGNPDLKPEIADTWSGGIVLTPKEFVRGFSLSVDYYHIAIANAIAGIGAQTIIDDCISSDTFCDLIHRAPGTGSLFLGTLGYVQDTKQNTASYETSGIDFAANYRTNLSDWGLGNYGGLNFDFTGTYTIDYNIRSVKGTAFFNCAGFYGTVCQGTGTPMTAPTPSWRHKFRVTWNTPWYGIGVSAQWRYIGGLTVDALSSNPLLSNPKLVFPVDDHLPSVSYLDLDASWRIRDGYTFRVGVNNVIDTDPPLIGSNNLPAVVGNGNTYPQFYDALGRYIFFNITADF